MNEFTTCEEDLQERTTIGDKKNRQKSRKSVVLLASQ